MKSANKGKKCYCVFVSPETSQRMIDGIRDHNQQRASEKKDDLAYCRYVLIRNNSGHSV